MKIHFVIWQEFSSSGGFSEGMRGSFGMRNSVSWGFHNWIAINSCFQCSEIISYKAMLL